MEVSKSSNVNNNNPSPSPVKNTINTVKEYTSNALKSGDDFLTKKVKNEGNNPFGNRSDVNEKNAPKGELEKQFIATMKRIDINNDGFINKRELSTFENCNKVDNKEAAMIGALLDSYGKLENLSDDEMGLEIKGITKKDIIALDELPESSDLKSNTEGLYYNNLYKISSAESTLKKDGEFKLPAKATDVNYKDIHQGSLGDCYFLASLASFAQKNPQKIVDMIKDNKDGSFDVKFPDRTVRISAPNKTELGMYSSEGKSAWVPIIEKGYAEYRKQVAPIKKTNEYDHIGKGSMIIGRGIYELTGHLFDTDILKVHTTDDLRKKLTKATDNDKMMVAALNKGIISKNKYDLPDGHAYTVLGYDSKTDMVKIRNPWGSGTGNVKGGQEGIFELPLSEFQKTFSEVAYER
ncbi:MAG: C2 family cysteine protease [Candidatus Sericytochromatia bacterium]